MLSGVTVMSTHCFSSVLKWSGSVHFSQASFLEHLEINKNKQTNKRMSKPKHPGLHNGLQLAALAWYEAFAESSGPSRSSFSEHDFPFPCPLRPMHVKCLQIPTVPENGSTLQNDSDPADMEQNTNVWICICVVRAAVHYLHMIVTQTWSKEVNNAVKLNLRLQSNVAILQNEYSCIDIEFNQLRMFQSSNQNWESEPYFLYCF